MIEVVEVCSLARRMSLTRVLHDIRHNGPSSFGDVVELADYAVHMRKALAHIIDKSETLEEARLIAAAARMGEEWR